MATKGPMVSAPQGWRTKALQLAKSNTRKSGEIARIKARHKVEQWMRVGESAGGAFLGGAADGFLGDELALGPVTAKPSTWGMGGAFIAGALLDVPDLIAAGSGILAVRSYEFGKKLVVDWDTEGEIDKEMEEAA